jgi:tryptophan synthase alpha chain
MVQETRGRIAECFTRNAERNEKVLALFLTAGFPTLGATLPLVLELEKAGADIIEIGMPFSDPIADGPVIQQSSATALTNGVTLPYIVKVIREIRSKSALPLVLMGYLNPILRYGPREFFNDVAAAGGDAIILPELPLEESHRYRNDIQSSGLQQIQLVTPASSVERIRQLDAASEGFLYCVSTTGVTGGSGAAAPIAYLKRVKDAAVRNPVMVGFGITGPGEARRCAGATDGVIVGSAFLAKLVQVGRDETMGWVRSLKGALQGEDRRP